jgi:hypothetical protein
MTPPPQATGSSQIKLQLPTELQSIRQLALAGHSRVQPSTLLQSNRHSESPVQFSVQLPVVLQFMKHAASEQVRSALSFAFENKWQAESLLQTALHPPVPLHVWSQEQPGWQGGHWPEGQSCTQHSLGGHPPVQSPEHSPGQVL